MNPDCSNHLVNIMRATVCLCDQPLCNGLFALANFTSLNSRIFSNNNLLLKNNHINTVSRSNGHGNMAAGGNVASMASSASMASAGSSASIDNANKENFMPLHDFNEQRIAAMLGQASPLRMASATSCGLYAFLVLTSLTIASHLAQI